MVSIYVFDGKVIRTMNRYIVYPPKGIPGEVEETTWKESESHSH